MKFDTFTIPFIILMRDWQDAMQSRKGWRKGQLLFNTLAQLAPEVSESLRGTEKDPYYDDKKIPDALAWIYTTLKEWEEAK